ncbi:SWIM zinc finger-containing protein [Methanoculleus sediminis]|uniref:SWIM zinc finger-containing protein n=1 Tax=Methanoculleus sediminis TaxID=1550566 RepID=A0A0H1QY16_9EURY|nr:SWIM zinc finger family protein [Methanoculleus sediminis]KLK87813.1 SWIM zinc finger-containing protein [Methanoculleus sediminis]
MTGIWQKMERDRMLTPEFRACIERVYGERGRKALEAVDAGQVKRYLDFFVVVGRSSEYIVEGDFCTCSDFLFRGRECWHILAVRIAERTGLYESYDLWYQDTWKT